MKLLNTLIWSILLNTRRYEKLKNGAEQRLTSVTLGIWAIVSTIVGTAFAVLSIWLLAFLIDLSGSLDSLETLLTIVGIFLLIVLLVTLIIQFIVNGLVCAILQIKLNKKPIGWISLMIWFAIIIAAIIIVATVIF